MARLKFRPGLILAGSKSNPEVKRWQKANQHLPAPVSEHINDSAKLLEHFHGAGHGEAFSKAVTSLKGFNEKVMSNSRHSEVVAEYHKTTIKAGKKGDIRVFGIPLYIGPHYNPAEHQIVVYPDDLKGGKRGMGKTIADIAKGDFGTVMIHEAGHAWDFARARTRGHPNKSYWASEVHPKIAAKCARPPAWMRTGKGEMGRLAYAAMIPHEMPTVMTEFAHIDHARYHAACELFKEDHGVDLDGHLTEFWGTKITPPRPTDGSVERLKESAKKRVSPIEWANRISAAVWDPQLNSHMQSYADAADGVADITHPDHRLSNLPLDVIRMLFPHLFASPQASPGTEPS